MRRRRGQRGYERMKGQVDAANLAKDIENARERVAKETQIEGDTARRAVLRVKALRDIRGWTGEYREPQGRQKQPQAQVQGKAAKRNYRGKLGR